MSIFTKYGKIYNRDKKGRFAPAEEERTFPLKRKKKPWWEYVDWALYSEVCEINCKKHQTSECSGISKDGKACWYQIPIDFMRISDRVSARTDMTPYMKKE